MTIKLNNAARSTIKAALRGKVAGLDSMTKDALIAAAEANGLDVVAIVSDAEAAAQTAAAFPVTAGPVAVALNTPEGDTIGRVIIGVDPGATEDMADTDEAADAIETLPDAARADVDAIMQDWRDLNPAGFKSRLADLAARAHKPAEIRIEYQGGPAPKIGTQICQRTGHTTAGALFGSEIAEGALAKIKMAVWDCATAPAIDPHYVWPAAAGAVVSQLFKRHKPAMIWGPAGTGKTSFAQQLCAHLKRPYVRISCHSQTDGQTLVGMTAPAAGGGTEWKDGQLTAAMRIPGAIVLIDEPSVARPGAMYALQAVLDSRELHIEETGEVVKAADGVLFILADNTNGSGDTTGQYGASHELTEAQRDRPGITIRVDYLPADIEAKVLSAKTGCHMQLASLLVGYATATRQKAKAGDLPAGIGLRRLMSWAELISDGVNPTAAAEGAFLDRMSPERAEVLRQLLVTHCNVGQVRDAARGKAVTVSQPAPDAIGTTGFSPIND